MQNKLKFENQYLTYQKAIELDIHKTIEYYSQKAPSKILLDAIKYSLIGNGKRLRPVLALATNALFQQNDATVLPFATSIEMIHTYSLIHDDLPAMDNDDFRRGKQTNHIVFGEAMAILAGDALLNLAYENLISGAQHVAESQLFNYIEATKIVANASGILGMVGGQAQDIVAQPPVLTENMQRQDVFNLIEQIESIQENKTGALIFASVVSSAKLNGANKQQLDALCEYSNALGKAFQLVDDILDITSDKQTLGKTANKDERDDKPTFARVFGAQKATKKATILTNYACEQIEIFGEKSEFLVTLAHNFLHRKK